MREVVCEHASGESLGFLGRISPRKCNFRLPPIPPPLRRIVPCACEQGGGKLEGEVCGGEIKVMGDRAEDFRIFGHYG
jgi:hypothetical protein